MGKFQNLAAHLNLSEVEVFSIFRKMASFNHGQIFKNLSKN